MCVARADSRSGWIPVKMVGWMIDCCIVEIAGSMAVKMVESVVVVGASSGVGYVTVKSWLV